LLDLQSAGIPPRQSNQKRVGPRASCKPGRFRIEEKPFCWIAERSARFALERRIAIVRKQIERGGRGFREFGSGEPVSNREVFAEMIGGHSGAKKAAESVVFAGRSNCSPARRKWTRGL